MRNRRRQGGYTLLEVVVAFAILVLSLSALFQSFSMTLGRSEKARNQGRALLLAESTRDRIGGDLPATLPLTEGADEDCSWTVRSRPLPRNAGDHPLATVALAVAVDVSCGGKGTLGTAHLDTIALAAAQ